MHQNAHVTNYFRRSIIYEWALLPAAEVDDVGKRIEKKAFEYGRVPEFGRAKRFRAQTGKRSLRVVNVYAEIP